MGVVYDPLDQKVSFFRRGHDRTHRSYVYRASSAPHIHNETRDHTSRQMGLCAIRNVTRDMEPMRMYVGVSIDLASQRVLGA